MRIFVFFFIEVFIWVFNFLRIDGVVKGLILVFGNIGFFIFKVLNFFIKFFWNWLVIVFVKIKCLVVI